MTNTYLTIGMVTSEALRVLENNLTFTNKVNRQFDDSFGVDGAKIGTTLNVRKPTRYVGRTGQAMSLEDATETQVPVKLDTQFGVDVQFSSQDLALSIDDFSNRFITPAIATIANKIDRDGLQLYKDVYNTVGTPATTPTALLTYLTAGVRMDDDAAPMDGMRCLILTPLMQATIVDALKGLFQQSSAIASQYTKGVMGTAAGFDWAMDQNVATHTAGTFPGTPLVNGASQTGSSLVTDGWTASQTGILKEGDVIQLASVNHVNPQSRQTNSVLQDFVVTADVDSDGSGDATIPISPSITIAGSFQTVTGSPADNAVITLTGAASAVSPQGLAFHRDAFTLATCNLPVPRGVDMGASRSDKQLGLSVRMVRQYTISDDQFPCRLDVLYGWKTLRPELACRVAA